MVWQPKQIRKYRAGAVIIKTDDNNENSFLEGVKYGAKKAVKAVSDVIDTVINEPIGAVISAANDVTGGIVYDALGNEYVQKGMSVLTPSKWIGMIREGYAPWDHRNTGTGSYETDNVLDTVLMIGTPISKLKRVRGPIVADIGKQVTVIKPWDGTFTMDDVVKIISKPISQNAPISLEEILSSTSQAKYVVKQRLPTNLHYRQVGDDAINDLLESGIVRGKNFPISFFSHGKLYTKKPTRSEYLLSMIPQNVRIKLDNIIQKATKNPYTRLFTNYKINMAKYNKNLIVGKEMPDVKYMPVDNGGLIFGMDKDAGIKFPITEGLEQTTPIYNGRKNALPLSKVCVYTFDPITGQYVNYNLLNNAKLVPWIFGGATIKELNNNQ